MVINSFSSYLDASPPLSSSPDLPRTGLDHSRRHTSIGLATRYTRIVKTGLKRNHRSHVYLFRYRLIMKSNEKIKPIYGYDIRLKTLMKSGYVYVISTDLYRSKDIYKIGFTDNLERRLKQFNNTRTQEDQYYIVNVWKTVKYTTLETCIHQALVSYKLKNELFQCSLTKINDTVKNIFTRNSFFNHYDIVIEGATLNKAKWNKNHFSIMSGGLEIMMNDKNMIGEVKRWISVSDKYNLYQFICPSYFDDLLSFLKETYSACEVDDVATILESTTICGSVNSISDELAELCIE